ncbi:hypothetical protein ACCUM_0343 [Candidatus Accumulibacter phosphatis]|uniref:Uncharacterized protein n=2 Tax=Candidatus Accumulibacter TaxID=327159 RepID=A0A080MCE4_9PROT|nr:MAG: hypothetical protein AW06_000054 [Candidatus Accumulibacter cognatus]TMQ75907.1 hypothetical protein ACCUM_0343 [Candidatus Accumulibacter phosphatis]
MVRLPALILTNPASPEDRVEESILPALSSSSLPVASTYTLPPLPVLPEEAPLLIPVLFTEPWPSMVISPALTCTDPACPEAKVEE